MDRVDDGIDRQRVPQKEENLFPTLIVLILCISTTFILGLYGGSVLWIPLILVAFYFILQRRLNRIISQRRNAVERTLRRQKIENHYETTEWLNFMTERIWKVLEPEMCIIITERVNAKLAEKCPKFLNSLELSEFTLGSSPPALVGTKVYPSTPDNVIHLDVEVSFVPNEQENFSNRSLGGNQNEHPNWNSKIILTARIGRGMVGMDIPILLKEISFFGRARIQLELAPNIPFLSKIQVSFLEIPKIDFILRPLKSIDFMDLPGLSDWLMSTITGAIDRSMVDPNILTVPIKSGKFALTNTNASMGILKIRLVQMRGIAPSSNNERVYVKFQVGGKFMAKSRSVSINAKESKWNQHFYCLLDTLQKPLSLMITNQDNQLIGTSTYSLADIQIDSGGSENVWRTIIGHGGGGKVQGEVNFGLSYFAVGQADEGSVDPEADLNIDSGIYAIQMDQVKNVAREGKKHLNVYYEIYIHPSDHEIDPMIDKPVAFDPNFFSSSVHRRVTNPKWDDTWQVFVLNKWRTSCTIVLRHGSKEEVIYGQWSGKLATLQNRSDWFPLEIEDVKVAIGEDAAMIHASFHFNPVRVDVDSSISSTTLPAHALVRIRILSATGLEKTKGLSVHVYYDGKVIGKTLAAAVNENPVWNKTLKQLVQKNTGKLEFVLLKTGGDMPCVGKVVLEDLNEYLDPENDGFSHVENMQIIGEKGPIKDANFRFCMESWIINRGAPEPTKLEGSSNCGLLEIETVSVKGMLSSTLDTLYFVQIFCGSTLIHSTGLLKLKNLKENIWTKFGNWVLNEDLGSDFYVRIRETSGGSIDTTVGSAKVVGVENLMNTWILLNAKDKDIKLEDDIEVKVNANYWRLPIKLDTEAIQSGTLKIELLEGKNLLGVDKQGKSSDPFCVLRLNNEKFFKSAVHKKTLNPQFKESTNIDILDKDTSTFEIELRDWNLVTMSSSLGRVLIDLQSLPLDEWKDFEIPLDNVSRGIIHFRLYFQYNSSNYKRQKDRISLDTSELEALKKNLSIEMESIKSPNDAADNVKDSNKIPGTEINTKYNKSPLSTTTAEGLRIKLVSLDPPPRSSKKSPLKVKVKYKKVSIYKTKKSPECKWNEIFVISPEALTDGKSFNLEIKKLRFRLNTGDLHPSGKGSMILKSDTLSNNSHLLVEYSLTTSALNLINLNDECFKKRKKKFILF